MFPAGLTSASDQFDSAIPVKPLQNSLKSLWFSKLRIKIDRTQSNQSNCVKPVFPLVAL
jgi:hypothetical protein